MDVCFQVKEENIEFKEAKENFHAISAIHTEIDIKEEPLEKDNFLEKTANDTGKSFSEALIFASINPRYDNRLFIKLQVRYMKIPSSNLGRTSCVQK